MWGWPRIPCLAPVVRRARLIARSALWLSPGWYDPRARMEQGGLASLINSTPPGWTPGLATRHEKAPGKRGLSSLVNQLAELVTSPQSPGALSPARKPAPRALGAYASYGRRSTLAWRSVSVKHHMPHTRHWMACPRQRARCPVRPKARYRRFPGAGSWTGFGRRAWQGPRCPSR